MFFRLPCGWSFGTLTLLLLLSLSPPLYGERLPIKSYTAADGLPHNEVNKIVRDARGFLWFCTANGLSRFDGYTFTNFGVEQGLPHANVTDFLETRNGEYWLGTNAGLVRFNPRGAVVNHVIYDSEVSATTPMFTVIRENDTDRRTKLITVLMEGHDGTIWYGTYKGLHRLIRSAGRFVSEFMDVGMPAEYPEQLIVTDLLEDNQGSLWLASPSGLYRRWPDSSVARYTEHEGLPNSYLSDLLQDSHGQLWAASLRGGFFSFAADSSHSPPSILRSYRAKDGLTTDWVFQLFETSDGQLKIATNKGLAEFYPDGPRGGRSLHLYTTRNGLLYREINALAEDSGGNLWIGTISGAMKLVRHGFISYGTDDGLLWVGAIIEDRAGGVCLRGEVLGDKHATIFDGGRVDRIASEKIQAWPQMGRYDGQQFKWFAPDALGYYYGWVSDKGILQSRNGEWWIGTGAGLYRFGPADDFTQLKAAHPLAHYVMPQVYRIFEDSRGDIWVATAASPTNGLARWQRSTETWHDLASTPGLPPLSIERAGSIGEDREGNVWVGFGTGAARFKGESCRYFGSSDGLPPGRIEGIYSDRVGRLWFTSSQSGLIRSNDPGATVPSFINYKTTQGLSSNQLNVIVEDRHGNLYLGSDHGLDNFNPTTGRVKHYSTADGLAPGTIYDALLARDGTLWVGTREGLSRFIPTDDASQDPAPLVVISSLEVAGVRQNISAVGETEIKQPDLAPDRNQLHIEFVGLSFAPGEVLRYQYKLEGTDIDWTEPANQRSVNYANLAPGGYRFLVRAINSEGLVSTTPAALSFTVLRPIWRRWWFVTLAALGVGALGLIFYRFRVARIYELANIRTRIATDLHDDVGSGLSQVSLLSEVISRRVGKDDSVIEQLSLIGQVSRDLVDSMSDIVWAINPGRDRLSDLSHRMRRFASDIFSTRNIDLTFEGPSSDHDIGLGPEVRRELYLIFKEAVNNVARHSQCTQVKIKFQIEDGLLKLVVHDNGGSFDTETDREGNGLRNMRMRAGKLGGQLQISSRNGSGTSIDLTVPLRRRAWLRLKTGSRWNKR